MIPKTRVHLFKIMNQLQSESYDVLITQSTNSVKKNCSIDAIVKSYFWASRTINNCTCLPRSIALYQKLKASGFLVNHKFGVNKQDKSLAAHAWVEYQGKPLNESKDIKQRFDVMNHLD